MHYVWRHSVSKLYPYRHFNWPRTPKTFPMVLCPRILRIHTEIDRLLVRTKELRNKFCQFENHKCKTYIKVQMNQVVLSTFANRFLTFFWLPTNFFIPPSHSLFKSQKLSETNYICNAFSMYCTPNSAFSNAKAQQATILYKSLIVKCVNHCDCVRWRCEAPSNYYIFHQLKWLQLIANSCMVGGGLLSKKIWSWNSDDDFDSTEI